MRVVISGYYGYGNTGDEAVLAGLLATMRGIEPEIEAIVISGDPAATGREHGVRAIGRSSARGLWRALRAADGLVSGGGSLLQDASSARPVAYYTGVMHAARLAGRRYAVHAQGLGPIRRAPNRRLARYALERAAAVSLRDPDSIRLAGELGVRRPIGFAPDPALALQPPAGEPANIVVALRPWPGMQAHLAALRRGVEGLATELPVVALPMQEPVDRALSEALVADIGGASVAPATGSLEGVLSVIASARAVIGMRLHALILAAAAGVPGVAISYDPKVSSWAALAGQAVAGDVRGPLDAEDITRAVRDAISADPEPYRSRIEALRAEVGTSTVAMLRALRADQGPG